MLEDIQSGKRIYVSTNQRKVALAIRKFLVANGLDEDSIFLHTGEEKSPNVDDVNVDWYKTCVITTTSVTCNVYLPIILTIL